VDVRFGKQHKKIQDFSANFATAEADIANLIDYLVGSVDQRCGYSQAKHPGGLRIENELELVCLHYWQLRGPLPP